MPSLYPLLQFVLFAEVNQNSVYKRKWKNGELEKNYKIKFVGNTYARNWVKFGHPVTSTFYQK